MQCFIPLHFVIYYSCFFLFRNYVLVGTLIVHDTYLQKSHAVTNSIWAKLFFAVAPFFCQRSELNDGLSDESHDRRVILYLPLMRQCHIFLFTCTCQSSHTCAYKISAGLAPFALLTLLFAARPLDPCCHLQLQAVQALPPL